MLQLKDDHFEIGGVSAVDLVNEHGSPLYAYDGNLITQQYESLKKAFGGMNLQINYACKP